MNTPKFHPGQIVATPGALAALQEAGESPLGYLRRHVAGEGPYNQRLALASIGRIAQIVSGGRPS